MGWPSHMGYVGRIYSSGHHTYKVGIPCEKTILPFIRFQEGCTEAGLMASMRAQIIFLSEIRTSRYISSQLNSRFNIADNFVVASKAVHSGE